MKPTLKLMAWCFPALVLMLLALLLARRALPFEFSSFALLAPAGLLALASRFLRRRTDLGAPPAIKAEFLPLGLFGLGYAGSVLCFYLHICMDGHMAHPSLISKSDYYLDWAWAICLASSAFFSLRIWSRYAFATCSLVLFVLVYRFGLQSLGGWFTIPI